MLKCTKNFKTGFAVALVLEQTVIEVLYNPRKPSDLGMEEYKRQHKEFLVAMKVLKQKRAELEKIEKKGVVSLRAGAIKIIDGVSYFFPSKTTENI